MTRGKNRTDRAAERMRHQHQALGRTHCGQQRCHIAAQFLDVIPRTRCIRQAMPAQIERNHAAVVMKMIELKMPVSGAPAEAVNEHQCAQGIARAGIDHRETHCAAVRLRQRYGAAV